MRVLVTGALGTFGREVVASLRMVGLDVVSTDLRSPNHEDPCDSGYMQADLTDPSEALWLTRGVDAVVHCAAIPDPLHHAPWHVYQNNVVASFNVIEASTVSAVDRVVFLSSETVLGFQFAARPELPARLPITEATPARPSDPYGLSKYVGEVSLEAATRRGLRLGVALRPSWIQYASSYRVNLEPYVSNPDLPSQNLWCYTDARDLCSAVVQCLFADLEGFVSLYAVNPDSVGALPLSTLVDRNFGSEIVCDPSLACAIDSGRARELLKWTPQHSWREHFPELS
jgi:nucleoside-diphosphate-sugar epimerase